MAQVFVFYTFKGLIHCIDEALSHAGVLGGQHTRVQLSESQSSLRHHGGQWDFSLNLLKQSFYFTSWYISVD